MNQPLQLIFRTTIALISIFVVVRFSPVVLAEWNDGNACPKLGPLPACYLVVFCYALIGVVAAINPRRLNPLFFIGWLPVFAMALTGTSLEILGHGTCPVSDSGVPMCYYSLLLAVVLLPMFWLSGGFKKINATNVQP